MQELEVLMDRETIEKAIRYYTDAQQDQNLGIEYEGEPQVGANEGGAG